MPLSPPVSSTHWKAPLQAIWAKASVSMAAYTPERRTQNQPNTAPASPASSGAASSPSSIGAAKCFRSKAAP